MLDLLVYILTDTDLALLYAMASSSFWGIVVLNGTSSSCGKRLYRCGGVGGGEG